MELSAVPVPADADAISRSEPNDKNTETVSVRHEIQDAVVTAISKETTPMNKREAAKNYKGWGNRTPSSDPLKIFWSVRRAHDTIIDSIEMASEPFIDKPFSLQNLLNIAETVNSALRRWTALGATLGGRVWLDPQLNTKETWANGHLYISYDAEAPAPIEHITFMFNRNLGYYEELAANAVREITRIAGTAITA